MVRIRSRCGSIGKDNAPVQCVQVERKKDRVTAKNEEGRLAIIVVDGKQKLAVPEAQAERHGWIATSLAVRFVL